MKKILALALAAAAALLVAGAASAATLDKKEAESATNLAPFGGTRFYESFATGQAGTTPNALRYEGNSGPTYTLNVGSDGTASAVVVRSRVPATNESPVTLNVVVDGQPQVAKNISRTANAYAERVWNLSVQLGPDAHTVTVRGGNLGSAANDLITDYVRLEGTESPAPETPCDISSRIEAAPAGGTVDLPDGCTAREEVRLTKPLTIIGGPGVELKGTDLWTRDFSPDGLGNWRSTKTVPVFTEPTTTADPNNPELCATGTTCDDVEGVYVGGRYLVQRDDGDDPGPGEFALDAQRRVLLGSDPGSSKVEVTARQTALNSNGRTLTLRDVDISQVASYRQSAAVKAGTADAVFDNVRVAYAHGSGLSCGGEARCEITDSLFEDNGTVGIASSKALSLLISGNRVTDNGHLPDADYDDGFESAGMKITGTTDNANRTIEDNEADHNTDRGIWIDVNANDVTVQNNRVHHNDQFGIHYEISRGGRILDNVLWENGWVDTTATSSNSADIYNSQSSGMLARGNLMAWSDDGYAYIGGPRQLDNTNNRLESNTIILGCYTGDGRKHLASSWNANGGGNDITGSGGFSNRYSIGCGEASGKVRYQFGTAPYVFLSQYNATPGEEDGTLMTAAQRDAALTAAGVPLQPEH